MIRYITESEVAELVTITDLIAPVSEAFRDHASGIARDTVRQRTHMPQGSLHVLQAASERIDRIGFKSYFPGKSARTFLVQLMELSTGRLLGLVEADALGIMRTAAATAVATRALARADASVLACFGSGRHAVPQLRAVAAVRPIAEVRVFGRNTARLERFCREAARHLPCTIKIAESREAAIAGADIINIVTRADTPLFDGTLLEAGMHVNAVGSNALSRREIDLAAIRLSEVIVVDSVAVAMHECGDLAPAADAGLIDWHILPELGNVLRGTAAGRSRPEQISLFESQGMGILDLYAANFVLNLAAEKRIGKQLDI